MQRSTLHELDARLESIYRRQIELYSGLLKLTDNLSETLSSNDSEESLASINETMAAVSELDSEVVPVRETWKRLGGQPNGTLAQALAEVEQLIVELMRRLGQAEQRALDAKSKLTSPMSDESRRRRMAAAYQAGRKLS